VADSQGNGTSNGADTPTGGGTYQGPRAADPAPHDTHHDDPEYITRTRFLTGVAVAGGGVLTAAILVPVVGFAVAPTVGGEDYRWVDIGPLSDFPDGQTSSIAVSGPDPEADRRVFLRRKDATLTAIWNRCAHLGCPVNYSAGSDGFACPCHGGAYDSLGLVTAGPPPRPLDRFDVKVVDVKGKDVAVKDAQPDHRVLIGKPYSIDADGKPYKLHGPGEPVNGVLANLYPL
jgi:menaquinol-cytochrome c reductase iron-sulfur subunit